MIRRWHFHVSPAWHTAAIAAALLAIVWACTRPVSPPAGNEHFARFNSLDQLRKSKGVVLLDFYADWCQPCQQQKPVVAQVAEQLKGVATVAAINVDQQGDLASAFSIQLIPTLIVLKDGLVAERLEGLHDNAGELEDLLRKVAGNK